MIVQQKRKSPSTVLTARATVLLCVTDANKIIKIIVKTRGFRGHVETIKIGGLNMGRLVSLVSTREIVPIKQKVIPIKLAKATIGVDISIMSRDQLIRKKTILATALVQVKHLHLRMVKIIRGT